MISELRFAKAYNSLWRSLAPTMELFVRKANQRLYERHWPQLASNAAPGTRALINQVAFRSVVNAVAADISYERRIRFVEDRNNLAATEESLTGQRFLSATDLDESSALAKRMCTHLFRLRQDHVVFNPRYEGCGIINACFGDAISDNEHIIELKDGDRPFRSYEFRQVTIYGALHLNSTGRLPRALAVINSRRGVSVELPIDAMAAEVAGQSGYDYLREVIRVISDVTISP
ncbi:hypothetical protein H8B02_30910 [Bradyrhizobium sp. Pear77]|uniref:hypothetical protein n=1 Tax=Bradyrhizobium altum TaxID=1571202 RepID=UPI001E5C85BC|nr:hypothetical protein [Bradyrhizobium altum]MCC8957682.1 hypothetical protein [Bradyrhizobium altum]